MKKIARPRSETATNWSFSRRFQAVDLLLVLFVLGLTGAGCGDARNAAEGDFDRWDACERMVSLCGDTRDDLARCVSQIEENYPDPSERTEIVRCMQEAPTCQDMIENCNLGLDPAE